MRVANVVPDTPVSNIEATYTYLLPHGGNAGDAVLIPFGGRTLIGFIARAYDAAESDFDFSLKPASEPIEGLSLPAELLELLEFLAERYLTTLGSAVAVAMPPGTRSRISSAYSLTDVRPSKLSPASSEIIKYFEEQGGTINQKALAKAKSFAKTAIAALVRQGILKKVSVLPKERKVGSRDLILANAEHAQSFIDLHGTARPAQAACLQALLDAPQTPMSISEIAALAGVSNSVVAKLTEANLLRPKGKDEAALEDAKILNEEQSNALAKINSSNAGRFLLHGVTGSGKTEVYLQAISATIAAGGQALYIVPEIALTAQVVGQLRARFGPNVAVMHSALAEGERLRHWRRIRNGDAPVVIGARSAIFAPLTNLKLIIVDEEHENSYKQDTTPRYHLRELAERRAEISGGKLILGSATPSVETYYRASMGQFELLKLTKRAVAMDMPNVSVTDLRDVYRSGRPSIIGARLHDMLEVTLARKEQAILFINRRAYAHSLLCRECGQSPKCPSCSVSLTYYKRESRIKCHHCGLSVRAPDTCPNCGSYRLRTLGLGTEKVEDFVKSVFPEARVGRLDRDSARRRGSVEEIFSKLREGSLDILVGTQMVAKGLDFPNVTLVGVIAADTGLNMPDFRATERTFQLLTQVGGRAGRRGIGNVIIQTFQPDHPAISFAGAQDYEDFYNTEIEERRSALYPPFVELINVIASSEDELAAQDAIRSAYDYFSSLSPELVVVGPADCPISRVRGKWRKHLLLKVKEGFSGDLRLPATLHSGKVQFTVDVNPNSLL